MEGNYSGEVSILNDIVAYWYDCIKNEDILEKNISIKVRKKAILYPFDKDPFIFNRKEEKILVTDKKLSQFREYVELNNYETYYGYPILFYFDEDMKKYVVAPLFIIKVSFNEEYLEKEEPCPSCGIQAFKILGFRTEEIADINQSLEKLFKSGITDSKVLAEKSLKIIQIETELPIREPVDPTSLTNHKRLSSKRGPGLYNKNILFAGENTVYNINLLRDLEELKNKKDLKKTALSFLISKNSSKKFYGNKALILPFTLNEYQIKALQRVFHNRLTVITGPPGTGKSQFISNLLINLFLQGKSVLFVSHTNEAVNVVYEKINGEFKNLLMRTGKKEFRQELKGKFNELILESERRPDLSFSIKELSKLWKLINKLRKRLIELDKLRRKYEKLYYFIHEYQESSFSKLRIPFIKIILDLKLRNLEKTLEKLPSRVKLEEKIKKLEEKFYILSREYVRAVFTEKILERGKGVGKVKYFLDVVDSRGPKRDKVDKRSFKKALKILKIWSSTLKSLRRTFPLSPGIFDYVIFDEASQVDLPSAAPALYRAKRAVIVGDPMQLSHISGITKDLDKELAKAHGLTQYKDIYPSKIRYYDVSLYKSAERTLEQKPILLLNHYRSQDQIISLCNKVFYKGLLRIKTKLDHSNYPSTLPVGVHWIDCKGEVFKHPAGSRVNYIEAHKVNEVFQKVLKKLEGTNLSIGIVTPYSRQREAIYDLISQSTPSELLEKHNVKILTAHKFQGSEKDIMIFSLVLASKGNGNSDRWYNIYPQILNVALSRARYLLYIVGDKEFCHGRIGVLKRLAEVYDEIKRQESFEKFVLHEKFDSFAEEYLFKKLQEVKFEKLGYRLIPKLVVKRYTLDFALVGPKKIDIECDGYQHEIVEGMPVLDDIERDEFLKEEGWRVLRFSNHRILSQTEKVIDEILSNL